MFAPTGLLLLVIAFNVGGQEIMSHESAIHRLARVGVTLCSRGNCIDRNNPNCTSLDQIRSTCVFMAHELSALSYCRVVVIGGTEVGHQPGTYSHYNGWKIDVADNECVTRYIRSNYASISLNSPDEERYLFKNKYVWVKNRGYWCGNCAAFHRQ